MIGGNADRKGHAAIEGEYRETPIAGRARGERSRRSYVNPDRYVKEIRLWIQRERGREEGGEGVYGVCVMSDPFTGFEAKMGRIGSWAWLSRSASMASMGVVNSGYHRECSAAGINETSGMTLIRPNCQ